MIRACRPERRALVPNDVQRASSRTSTRATCASRRPVHAGMWRDVGLDARTGVPARPARPSCARRGALPTPVRRGAGAPASLRLHSTITAVSSDGQRSRSARNPAQLPPWWIRRSPRCVAHELSETVADWRARREHAHRLHRTGHRRRADDVRVEVGDPPRHVVDRRLHPAVAGLLPVRHLDGETVAFRGVAGGPPRHRDRVAARIPRRRHPERREDARRGERRERLAAHALDEDGREEEAGVVVAEPFAGREVGASLPRDGRRAPAPPSSRRGGRSRRGRGGSCSRAGRSCAGAGAGC